MLKNSTKLTSLVVAAATVASMTPAFAAEKLADKDGTIYRAVSYKDGKVYIDGKDIQDAKDEDGVFFLDDGKSKEIDSDIDSGDEITAVYGEKYVEIEDGDYYVDLTNGKVTDDNLRKDDAEDAASELRKKIRKDDPSRYDEDDVEKVADVDVKDNAEIWQVPAAPYTTPYYQVDYLKFAEGKHDYVLGDKATVYTDGNGKYVDADNDLGKVNVIVNRDYNKKITSTFTTTDAVKAAFDIKPNGKVSATESIQFEEVGDEDNKAEDMKVKVYVKHIATLASDKDYVYRLAALKVEAGLTKEFDENGKVVKKLKDNEQKFTTMDQVCFGSTKNPVKVQADADGLFYVVQKISKEQGDDKDDAMLPKTTVTYFATENKDYRKKEVAVTTNDGDRRILADDDKFSVAEYGSSYDEKSKKDSNIAFTVVNGKITKYETTYETLNDNGSASNNDSDKFGLRTFQLKNSNGFYFLDQDNNDDDFDDDEEFATTLDKDGNIWKLDSGKIYKYKNDGSYELKYKCDGGLNELSVYDDDNLIAYNEDDDVYSIVGGKSSTGEYEIKDENKNVTTTAAAGWVKNADGTWSYNKADGTKAIGWLQSPASGLWYYMDANGIMMSNGWVQDGAYWYYLKADGAMATGWIKDKGTWYFLKKTPGNRGAMQTGWIQDGGKWYYCNASGAMLANTTVGGYKLGADGAWIK